MHARTREDMNEAQPILDKYMANYARSNIIDAHKAPPTNKKQIQQQNAAAGGVHNRFERRLPLHQQQEAFFVIASFPRPSPLIEGDRVWVRPSRVAAALQARAVLGCRRHEASPRPLDIRISPLENLSW